MIASKEKASVVFTAIALTAVMLISFAGMPAAAKTAANNNSGWTYFVSQKNSQLYRSHPDGSAKAPVSNVKTDFYAVSGNWIYYTPTGSTSGTYKIRTDGSGKTKLNNLTCAVLGVSGNYIYILYAKGGGGTGSDYVYRTTLDGKGLKKISKHYVYEECPFIVSNGYVYYSDGGILYRVRPDGTGEKKLTNQFGGTSSDGPDDAASFRFFINGGSMYYLYGTAKEYCTIYKMRPDGSGKASIGIKDAFDIASVDGSIYYRSKTPTGKIYKINSDGSGKTEVNSSSWVAIRAFGSKEYHRFHN